MRISARCLLAFGGNDRFQGLLGKTPVNPLSVFDLPVQLLTCFLRFFPALFPLFVAALATCFALLIAAFLILSLPFMLVCQVATKRFDSRY